MNDEDDYSDDYSDDVYESAYCAEELVPPERNKLDFNKPICYSVYQNKHQRPCKVVGDAVVKNKTYKVVVVDHGTYVNYNLIDECGYEINHDLPKDYFQPSVYHNTSSFLSTKLNGSLEKLAEIEKDREHMINRIQKLRNSIEKTENNKQKKC